MCKRIITIILSWVCLLAGLPVAAQADALDMIEPPFLPPVTTDAIVTGKSARMAASTQGPATLTVNEINVLFLYTPDDVRLYGSVLGVQNRIVQIVAYANTVYSNSGVSLHMNNVGELLVQYDNNNTTFTAFHHLAEKTHPAFSGVNQLRMQKKADFVVLLRPQKADTGVCGLAYANGAGLANPETNFWMMGGYAYSHVYINCQNFVLVHELGHNMGLVHSRTAVGEANAGKVYAYGAGYKITGDFSTVMAGTPAVLPLPYFASPSYACTGTSGISKPCGVDSAQSNGADAVQAINNIAAQLPHFSDDSDNDGMPDWFENFWGLNRFDPADSTLDADGDGLSNVKEFYAETYARPLPALGINQSTDTDNDGVQDGVDPLPTMSGNIVLDLNSIYQGSALREQRNPQ